MAAEILRGNEFVRTWCTSSPDETVPRPDQFAGDETVLDFGEPRSWVLGQLTASFELYFPGFAGHHPHAGR